MLGFQLGAEDEPERDKGTSGQSNSPSGENTRQESRTSAVSTDLVEESAMTALVVASESPTPSGGGFPSISSRASSSPDGQFGTDIQGYNPEYLSNFLTNWEAFPMEEFQLLSGVTQESALTRDPTPEPG